MLPTVTKTLTKNALRSASVNSAALYSTTTAKKARIVYTKTDEAPMLATYAFLPIIKRFAELFVIRRENGPRQCGLSRCPQFK